MPHLLRFRGPIFAAASATDCEPAARGGNAAVVRPGRACGPCPRACARGFYVWFVACSLAGLPLVAAETAAEGPAAYAAAFAADEPLAHWPLADSLEPGRAAEGFAAKLEAGGGPARFRGGPLSSLAAGSGTGSVDLGRGGWLRLPPCPALDAEELTVEMVFQPKYPKSGTLFGIRDGDATRFSLHYSIDSPALKLWNGSTVTEFEADRPITLNEWYHVVLAISPTDATVWLDGVRCRPSGVAGLAAAARGLPLLVGCSNAAGTAERAEILAAHLAVYPRRLAAERITAHAASLGLPGWARPRPARDAAAEIARTAERVAAIERHHGVIVQYRYSPEVFLPEAWRPASEAAGLPPDQMPRVLDEIEAFLRIVPAAVTRRDLETIYVVSHLSLNGSPVGALASGKSIYLCCDRPTFDIRCSLYHELSHILQVAHPIDDEAWKQLLPEGFEYLGADAGIDAFGFDDQLRNDGFILRYSLTNRHEDIAVLSDWLFVRKQQAVDLCEAHPAIRRKAAAVLAWYRSIDRGYDLRFYDPVVAGSDPPRISAGSP
jgi:hypothetical protein